MDGMSDQLRGEERVRWVACVRQWKGKGGSDDTIRRLRQARIKRSIPKTTEATIS
jgi:hypothetical protein